MSRIFGFKNRYPQKFLDKLAKDLGIKWTKVKPTLISKDEITSCPLPPPSGKLYYSEHKFKEE